MTAGSVIFSFQQGTFANHIQAYKAIQADIGEVEGFQHLSGFISNPNRSDLLIEARFTTMEARDRALQVGLTVGDASFIGTASSTGAGTKSFVHVALVMLLYERRGCRRNKHSFL